MQLVYGENMTSTKGITEQVFGVDLLTEQGMKPWWERMHGYLLAATITASGLVMYLNITGHQVDCLPSDKGRKNFTESEVSLINGYCAAQIPWYAIYAGVQNFVAASLILVLSNVWLNHPDVIDAFRTFVKAENIINRLNSRSKTLNRIAVSPVHSDFGEAFELRKACLLLWTHKNKIKWHYSLRNNLALGMTIIAFTMTIVILVLLIDLVVNPHFYCSVSRELKRDMMISLDQKIEYFCAYNYAKVTFPFVLLCSGAFFGQIVAIVIAKIKLRSLKINDADKSVLSDEFLEARAYCHFMTVFWMNANPVDSQRFLCLLDFIFSRNAVNSMPRFIPNAIIQVNPTTEMQDSSPYYQNPAFGHALSRSSDLTYVELYILMHRNGGNNALSKLYQIFRERNCGRDIDDIYEALGKVKFSKWDVDATCFLKSAAIKTYWKLFVQILNCVKDPMPDLPHPRKLSCGVYDFNFNQREEEEKGGRNILYYALCKVADDSEFSCTAAKHILACNDSRCPLIVHDINVSMTAEEFVNFQYESDPTFSDELKSLLLSLIRNTENPEHKFFASTK